MYLLGSNTEQQIIKLFSRGDASAMDMLYNAFSGYLTAVCSRYIANEDDVKDVLQESFIIIFTKIPSFEYHGKGSLKAWMTKIVVNESLSLLRKDKASPLVPALQEPPDMPDEEPALEDLKEKDILEMIRKLPTGYRKVFNLYVIDGYSHQEIAQMLGIQPATSASQFHRARMMLASMIRQKRNLADSRK